MVNMINALNNNRILVATVSFNGTPFLNVKMTDYEIDEEGNAYHIFDDNENDLFLESNWGVFENGEGYTIIAGNNIEINVATY